MSFERDWWGLTAVAARAKKGSTCMAFASSASGEEMDTFQGNLGDRSNLTAWSNADNVIKTVVDNCKNTVVIVHWAGVINMTWAEHPNVKAILFAGLPGQETGKSFADVLYGLYNPTGKLPFSNAKNIRDKGPAQSHY